MACLPAVGPPAAGWAYHRNGVSGVGFWHAVTPRVGAWVAWHAEADSVAPAVKVTIPWPLLTALAGAALDGTKARPSGRYGGRGSDAVYERRSMAVDGQVGFVAFDSTTPGESPARFLAVVVAQAGRHDPMCAVLSVDALLAGEPDSCWRGDILYPVVAAWLRRDDAAGGAGGAA